MPYRPSLVTSYFYKIIAQLLNDIFIFLYLGKAEKKYTYIRFLKIVILQPFSAQFNCCFKIKMMSDSMNVFILEPNVAASCS